ncbi:palmitoyltransferase swf1, variant 2 [Batrachochytrium dendrobatidis]
MGGHTPLFHYIYHSKSTRVNHLNSAVDFNRIICCGLIRLDNIVNHPDLKKRYLMRAILGKRGVAYMSRQLDWLNNDKHPLGQIFYLFLVGGGLIEFFLLTVSRVHKEMQWWIVIPIIVWTYTSFYMASTIDPGFITSKNVDRACQIFDYDYWLFTPRKCTTCKTLKPARSKHCSVCKGCIARLDHHCVWINNCVGHYNNRWFLSFLISTSMYCAMGAFYSFRALQLTYKELDLGRRLYRDPRISKIVNMPFWIQMNYLSQAEPRISAFFLFTGILAVIVFLFFLYQSSFVIWGITSNESFKWEDCAYAIKVGALEHVPKCVYDYNRDYRRLKTAVLVNGPKSRAARIFRQRTLEVDKIMQCSSDEDEAKSTHTQVSSKQDATQRGKTVVDEPTLVAYYLASTHGKRMSNIYNLGIWQNIMQVCFPQSLDLNQNKR